MRVLRFGIFGLGGLGSVGLLLLLSSACSSLKDVSVVPDGAIDDLDAGDIPEPIDEDAGSVSPPGTDPPPSGRVRLGNMLQPGARAMEVCSRAGASGTFEARIASNPQAPNAGGIAPGQVSTHFFLAVPGEPRANPSVTYQYRIVPAGGSCDDVVAAVNGPPLRQGGGTTIAVVGEANGGDAGDRNPRAIALSDNVTPAANATQFRAVHGIVDMSAFDVVINGETIVQGIRFGSAVGFPYANADTSGFRAIPAGIPENSTLTLRAGTTVVTFTVPQRQRRGIAVTLFTGGTLSAPVAQLCSDRSPPAGETLATCVTLPRARNQ